MNGTTARLILNRLGVGALTLLINGGSILCHRPEAESRQIQTPLRLVKGEVA